jgi:hypothetical protein
MAGLLEVFVGVLVGAGIAASDVPTREAHAQVGPGVLTIGDAVLAMPRCPRIRLGGINGRLEVFATIGGPRIRHLR